MKKIIPSICMLLVTAVLMGTSTYAWFSMNREVKATGMQVSAVTSSNLIISDKTINFNTDDSYSISLTDNANTYTALTPVSSANGKDFYITASSAEANDSAAVPSDATFTKQDKASDTKAVYYIVKSVFVGVKGVNDLGALSVNASVKYIDKSNNEATAQDIYKALRFAVYYKTGTNNAVIFGGATTTATQWNGVSDTGALNKEGGITTSVTTVDKATAIAGLSTLTAGQEYEIAIVVWLEGQDTNCTANKTNAASVALKGVSVEFTFTAAEKNA